MITLKVENGSEVIAESSGMNEVTLVYIPEYVPGDSIVIESDSTGVYLILGLDDAMPSAFVYLTEGRYSLTIPFEEKRMSYSPRAFIGNNHVIYARLATDEEIKIRKNLAFNPYDSHSNQSLYPIAQANVETRGESVFAARNTIDGYKANLSHGSWPFQSWGINMDPEAEMKIDFGREVIIDRAVFYLRADFPHDAWWEHATIDFSDGTSHEASLQKTSEGQVVNFPPKTVRWILLHKLIKANDPSPYPSLTQIEFYGTEK